MLMVCAEVALVEAELVGGLLGCPSCRGVLGAVGACSGAGCALPVGGSAVAAAAGAVSRVRGHARVAVGDRVLAPAGRGVSDWGGD